LGSGEWGLGSEDWGVGGWRMDEDERRGR